MSDTFYRLQEDKDGSFFLFGPIRKLLQEKLINVSIENCGDCGEDRDTEAEWTSVLREGGKTDEEAQDQDFCDLTEKTPGEAEFQYLRWLFSYDDTAAEAAAKKLGIEVTYLGGMQE